MHKIEDNTMKLTKQRLMEMAGLMTEEEQHLKMPFANNLPQGPKRIEWYGKHLAKMMTPADQEGPEGLLNALLDNPEDFPQNWRVAPEGELDYIESVADDIVAFANDYMDMPGFKGTRNALAGLSIREASVEGDDVLDLQSILQSYAEEVERVLAEVNELEQFVAGGIDSYEQETGDLRISQLRNQSARYIQSAETNLLGLSKALKRAQKGNA